MKIMFKPKIPMQVCKKCGCEVKIKQKDLELDNLGEAKTCFKCPFCWTNNDVKFKEDKDDEQIC